MGKTLEDYCNHVEQLNQTKQQEKYQVKIQSFAQGNFITAQDIANQLLHLQRPRKIISIGSMTSYQAVWNASACAAAIADVVQFTKVFSNELEERNVQINWICPGFFRFICPSRDVV